MKKIITVSFATLCLAAVSSLAFAAKPGFYAGVGAGYSKLATQNQLTYIGNGTYNSTSPSYLSGRLFGGFNLNPYFGIEAGYAKYGDVNYKNYVAPTGESLVGLKHRFGGLTDLTVLANPTSSTASYSLYAFDLVGKGYLPIGDTGINAYALAGLAYVTNNLSYTADSTKTNTTTSRLRPTYGVGVSYDIPQTAISTNLEFSRIQGAGNVKTDSTAIPNADMASLNISY